MDDEGFDKDHETEISHTKDVKSEYVEPLNALRSFMNEPNTPKKKNKRFKNVKSPPVLTSKKRLELHRMKEQEKKNLRQARLRKMDEKARKADLRHIEMINKAEERLQRLKKVLRL